MKTYKVGWSEGRNSTEQAESLTELEAKYADETDIDGKPVYITSIELL